MSTMAKHPLDETAYATRISALTAWLAARRRPQTRALPRISGSVLRLPQRFGDSYRWPHGSWTHSG